MLDAERKYRDYAHAAIKHKYSSAGLPEEAVRVRASAAGGADAFRKNDEQRCANQQQ